jgi:hypothetical protein
VAAALQKDLGIEAELVLGESGEFTVWVDGQKVAEKVFMTFPSPAQCVAAVRAALSPT